MSDLPTTAPSAERMAEIRAHAETLTYAPTRRAALELFAEIERLNSLADKSQTTEPLSQREREALYDIATWKGHLYTWKQASMRKLEARGLVRAVGMRGDQTMWELTNEGKNQWVTKPRPGGYARSIGPRAISRS